MIRHFLTIMVVAIFVFLTGCTSNKPIHNGVASFFSDQGPFQSHFVGFFLMDPSSEKTIYQCNAQKYFTPASNTKILTLAAALNHLGDSIASLAYEKKGDTTYLWGLGDPTLLHPLFNVQSIPIKSLAKKSKGPLLVCQNHFKDERFGAGWAWDDYHYGYQAEKSALPYYGNRIWLQVDSATQSIHYRPAIPSVDFDTAKSFFVQRAEFDNSLRVGFKDPLPNWQSSKPLYLNNRLFMESLSLDNSVQIHYPKACPTLSLNQVIYSIPVDTVYRRLMHQSDNFIAEQILLQLSTLKLGVMSTQKIISYLKTHDFADAPDELLWADGSGLSRYNLFTPRSIAFVLNEIYQKIPEERLFNIFAAGGQSGTIKNLYQQNPPFVFAKTGTLRNNHCLSGFIRTDSGRTLIFAFMHNNFPGSSSTTKPAMDQVLRFIKSHY